MGDVRRPYLCSPLGFGMSWAKGRDVFSLLLSQAKTTAGLWKPTKPKNTNFVFVAVVWCGGRNHHKHPFQKPSAWLALARVSPSASPSPSLRWGLSHQRRPSLRPRLMRPSMMPGPGPCHAAHRFGVLAQALALDQAQALTQGMGWGFG